MHRVMHLIGSWRYIAANNSHRVYASNNNKCCCVYKPVFPSVIEPRYAFYIRTSSHHSLIFVARKYRLWGEIYIIYYYILYRLPAVKSVPVYFKTKLFIILFEKLHQVDPHFHFIFSHVFGRAFNCPAC